MNSRILFLYALLILFISVGLVACQGGSAKDAVASLGDSNWKVRLKAHSKLVRMGEEAITPLLAGLGSDNEILREGATRALGSIGKKHPGTAPTIVKALKPLLHDKSDKVGIAAADSLGAMGEHASGVVPDLIQSFKIVKGKRSSKVAKALVDIGGSAETALVEALSDDDENIRFYAARTFGHEGAPSFTTSGQDTEKKITSLISLLEDDSVRVKVAALSALQRFGQRAQDAGPQMAKLTVHEERGVRVAAIKGLYEVGAKPEDSVPALALATRDESNEVRAQAKKVLEKMGDQAVTGLIKLLGSNDDNLRASSAHAIYLLGPRAQKAGPVLLKALTDESALVRSKAAWALSRIPIDGVDVRAKLEKLAAEDPDEQVRKEAKSALAVSEALRK